MTRVKYDVRGVESGSRVLVPAGVYEGKIVQADVTKPDGKDQRIELVVEVIKNKDHKGKRLYEYVNLESEAARWKLRELLEAVSAVGDGKGESGTLDTNKQLLNKVIGIKVFVRPADEARGFDEQSRIRRMFALDNGASAEPEEEFEEDEVEAEGDVDLADLDRTELKKYIKDEGLDIKVTRSMSDDDIREAIEELYEEEAEPEEEEPEDEASEEPEEDEDEEPEDEVDDYDGWSEDELKEELEQRSLSVRGSQKTLVARLRKDDAEEDKPF